MKLIYIFTGIILFWGCQQKELSDYSSPESTYKTYVRQAKTLRVVCDHRHYRRAIRCFTDEDWKWYEKNYDKIEADKEEYVYENLYKSKKRAYVFGRSVVLVGPSPDEEEYEIETKTSDKAVLRVKGYPEEINMIKTSRGWQIVGLFGVREKVSK
ncbi:hypothetical protein ACFLUV_02820 [Elusimicrobiota bacterium]